MADEVTTTKPSAEDKEKAKNDDKVAKALESLRQAMIDAGEDPGQVDAKLYSVRATETNIVGNLADLQRLGGEMAPKDSEPAFVMPPTQPLAEL